VRADFSLANELASVIHICELVEGLPLGILLAASWVETLSLEEIGAEIKRSLDFLESEMRGQPPRRRQMSAGNPAGLRAESIFDLVDQPC
jgi:predicted ATPase